MSEFWSGLTKPEKPTKTTYRIIRFYKDDEDLNRMVILRGLTLEQAQAHCHDPETSSETCKGFRGQERTRQYGPWFDGYEEDSAP